MAKVEQHAAFSEVDALFQAYQGRKRTGGSEQRTGRMLPYRDRRLHVVASYTVDQLPYIQGTNRALIKIYSRDFEGAVKDTFKKGQTFDEAFYAGVEDGMMTFAEENPDLLPALRAEVVVNAAGAVGFDLLHGAMRSYVSERNKDNNPEPDKEYAVFTTTNNPYSYTPNPRHFIGMDPTGKNRGRDEGMQCSGLHVAKVLFNAGVKVHSDLTSEHGFIPMEMDVPVGDWLPPFVDGLYLQEKEKQVLSQ